MICQSSTSENHINVATEPQEYMCTTTSASSVCIPECNWVKFLFKKDLEEISKRLALLAYTAAINLDDSEHEKQTLKNVTDDVSEIAVRVGVAQQVQAYLQDLTSSSQIVIDSTTSGTVDIYCKET